MSRQGSNPYSGQTPDCAVVRSDDGAVEFRLRPTSAGLHVQRVRLRTGSARIVMSMVFASRESFSRWCDADATRFDYPLIHIRMKRDGDALLNRHGC